MNKSQIYNMELISSLKKNLLGNLLRTENVSGIILLQKQCL